MFLKKCSIKKSHHNHFNIFFHSILNVSKIIIPLLQYTFFFYVYQKVICSKPGSPTLEVHLSPQQDKLHYPSRCVLLLLVRHTEVSYLLWEAMVHLIAELLHLSLLTVGVAAGTWHLNSMAFQNGSFWLVERGKQRKRWIPPVILCVITVHPKHFLFTCM